MDILENFQNFETFKKLKLLSITLQLIKIIGFILAPHPAVFRPGTQGSLLVEGARDNTVNRTFASKASI